MLRGVRSIHKAENMNRINKEIVVNAGGLYILGTERHESRRIDNQLRGRSGRQGDIGTSKFFLSLEDDLMRIFGSDKLAGMLTKLGMEDDDAIYHPWISKSLERAQKKVENMHYEMRKNVLKYDDVVNTQRKVIFEERKDIMFANSIEPEIEYMVKEKNSELINTFTPPKTNVNNWNIDGLKQEVLRVYGINFDIKDYVNSNLEVNSSKILEMLSEEVNKIFEEKANLYGKDIIRIMQKHIMLLTIDKLWKDHLYMLDKVRQSIGLRAYGQKDPLIEYKKEAYDLFEDLMYKISEDSISILAKVKLKEEKPNKVQKQVNSSESDSIDEVRKDFLNIMGTAKSRRGIPNQKINTNTKK